MRYKLLGKSGLRVFEATLGAMTFGKIEAGYPNDYLSLYKYGTCGGMLDKIDNYRAI